MVLTANHSTNTNIKTADEKYTTLFNTINPNKK